MTKSRENPSQKTTELLDKIATEVSNFNYALQKKSEIHYDELRPWIEEQHQKLVSFAEKNNEKPTLSILKELMNSLKEALESPTVLIQEIQKNTKKTLENLVKLRTEKSTSSMMGKTDQEKFSEIDIVEGILWELINLRETITGEETPSEQIKKLIQLSRQKINQIIDQKDHNNIISFIFGDLLKQLEQAKTKEDIENLSKEIDKILFSLKKKQNLTLNSK